MKYALLLATTLLGLSAAAATPSNSVSLAHFYTGRNCRGTLAFTAYVSTLKGDWNFGSCWGLTSLKSRSVYLTDTNQCYGSYPFHRYYCGSDGWTQVR